MPKLRFLYEYHVEILEDTVFLISEYRQHALTGRLYKLIAPLLNGDYTVEQMIQNLAGEVTSAQLHYTLNRLQTAGHLIEVDESLPVAENAYWSMQGITPTRQQLKVNIHQLGADAAGFAEHLARLGIEVGDPSNFDIVFVDDYLNPAIEDFNRQAQAAQRAWMIVKPVGMVLWVGPVFSPDSACWACLSQRLKLNRAVETFLQHKKGASVTLSRAALPSTIQTAFTIAATETARWLNGHSVLKNTVVAFDTLSLSTMHHYVVKRPQCPVCGEMLPQSHEPLRLESRKKILDADAGHRSVSAQETYDRYRHHVSPITGVVHRLQRVEVNAMIHVYDAGPNKSRPFDQWQRMRNSLRSSSAGKGTDDLQAKVSGLCEALERYSGVFQGDEPRSIATYHDVAADAIHPATCLLYSENQYNTREEWNAICPPHLQVSQPFDETREVEWTQVWSLTENRFKLLPTAFCYYYPRLPEDHRFCISDSNGNAAGSSLEDAILQGFMELVERDSISIWWYNRVRRPSVDLDSLNSPYIEMMKSYYASIHREFWVLDITTDLEIPTFVALSRRTDKSQEDIVMGFGAHFDAKIAIMRSLTELNQMLPPVMSIDKTGSYHSEAAWEINWWQNATLKSEPYLVPLLPAKKLSDYPTQVFDDLRDEVSHCVDILKRHNIEMLVLNQTRPDVGLPVVKVIAPGLRHFWARFALGRLYTVPVKLGWLGEPIPEGQLNPQYMIV